MLTSSTLSGRAKHNAEIRAESSSKPSEFRAAAERLGGLSPEQKAEIIKTRNEQFQRKYGPVTTIQHVDAIFAKTYNVAERRWAQEAFLSHVHGPGFIAELKASVDGDRGRYSDALSRAVGAAAAGTPAAKASIPSKPASNLRVELSPSGCRVVNVATGKIQFEHAAKPAQAKPVASTPAPAPKPLTPEQRVNAEFQARFKRKN
jgi:hypothetical protein